jgi:hypothetical protein
LLWLTVVAGLGVAWWCDGWLVEKASRDMYETAHKQLLDNLRSEVQRAANESGVTIQVKAAGVTITGRPDGERPKLAAK